jgi:elongation factor P
MKVGANTIRPGNILVHNTKLWVVSKIAHTQPGKGGAYIQVEMKDIQQGTKLNERFRSSEDVERAQLEEKEYQYLYSEGDDLVLMDTETYEQINLPRELVGDPIAFLRDEMMITVVSFENKPIAVELPEQVIVEVVEADAVVKGQTAASSYKSATLEGDIKVLVPSFIEAGNRIVVKTADGAYVERAKE